MRSLSLALIVVLCVGAFAQQELFDYVAAPDSNYAWVDTGIVINSSSTGTPTWVGYVLNMTSQGWLTAADTNRPIWYHTIVVIVPTELEITDHAFLYITGNHNGYVPGKKDGDLKLVTTMAVATKSLGAVLYQVPNEPVVFAEDPDQSQRVEDAMVAFTWKMFMENPDRPEWLAYLPMVKSAVRAMDTVTAYCKEKQLGNVQEYVIGGGSKRGWTTWLTGAVDKRVVGIVPIVMDMLNFVPNVLHMYEAYGGWTFVFSDYYDLNITGAFGTPSFDNVARIVDPLSYKKYLTMPKLVVDATGDEFFLPDDDWYWWGQLPGETYRLIVPNAEHSMATGVATAVPAVEAFYLSVVLGSQRPVLNWTIAPNGTIFAQTSTQPSLVILHTATTFDAVRRDFRLAKGDTPADPCHFIGKNGVCLNPVLWFGETIAPTSIIDGVYSYAASQPLPDSGWRGFLLQFIFPGPQGSTYHFTTQVSIIPNTFPFSPCEIGVNCQGVLV